MREHGYFAGHPETESISNTMADFDFVRFLLSFERYAMDPVFHHQWRDKDVLRRFHWVGELDVADLYDSVYSVYFSWKLFVGEAGE